MSRLTGGVACSRITAELRAAEHGVDKVPYLECLFEEVLGPQIPELIVSSGSILLLSSTYKESEKVQNKILLGLIWEEHRKSSLKAIRCIPGWTSLAYALAKNNVVISKSLHKANSSGYHTHNDVLCTVIADAASDAQPDDCLPESDADEVEEGLSHHHTNPSTIDDTEHSIMG